MPIEHIPSKQSSPKPNSCIMAPPNRKSRTPSARHSPTRSSDDQPTRGAANPKKKLSRRRQSRSNSQRPLTTRGPLTPSAITSSCESGAPSTRMATVSTTADVVDEGSCKVDDELYYHGLIARDDLPRLLKRHGDFLVRYSEVGDQQNSYVLSVMCHAQVRHLVMEQASPQGPFWMHKGRKFASVRELVEHYHSERHPLDGDVVLIKAVNRDVWELSHSQLTMGKKLGEGAFGCVYAGRLRVQGQPIRNVAVKEAHKDVPLDKAAKDELMAEARIMFENVHRNIVTIYGVAALRSPICIVMELVKGGTLKDYVREHKICDSELARYAHHAASGLKFLHEQNVVHRDVAARNCLIQLGQGAHHNTVKLSDFGLAKGIKGEEKLKKNMRMPIKWLAPETLKFRLFNKPSDVWAFGVLLWEVFSQGDDPYPSCDTLKDVMALVKGSGHMGRRDCEQVPTLVKDLMMRCWEAAPENRPQMADAKVQLKVIHYKYLENEKKRSNKHSRR